MGIPMIIGVTGHRAIREQDIPVLRAIVTAELKKMMTTYPHSSFIMLNSVASGADSLCAEAALSIGMKLVCPLPMPVSEYRKDFSGKDAILFDDLIQRADRVFVAPDTEPVPVHSTRDDHYRQAGIFVVTRCQLLLALWDGSKAKSHGCGTSEMVAYVMNQNGAAGESAVRAANKGAVLHIDTPQQKAGLHELAPKVRLLENEPGSLQKTWAKLDMMNAKAEDAVEGSMAELEWETDLRFR